MSFSPCKQQISDNDKSEDIILQEQIKGEKSIITENINPNDSIYRILWQKSYDLTGQPKDSSSVIQIIIYPKSGSRIAGIHFYDVIETENAIVSPDISQKAILKIDSIAHHEQLRINRWLEKLDIPNLIKNKEPCINNEFEFAEVLSLMFFYDIVPKSDDMAAIANDSINGK